MITMHASNNVFTSLNASIYLSFFNIQYNENSGIVTKRLIVNDSVIFLFGFDGKKLHNKKK